MVDPLRPHLFTVTRKAWTVPSRKTQETEETLLAVEDKVRAFDVREGRACMTFRDSNGTVIAAYPTYEIYRITVERDFDEFSQPLFGGDDG